MKHGIGVIGVGVWGCHSLERQLLFTGRAEIRALTSGDRFGAGCYASEAEIQAKTSELAREYGAQVLTDWRELVTRKDIDIISVMACPAVKEDIIIEALRQGKHVVTDKPLALTVDEARRILEAERQSTGRGYLRSGYQGRPAVRRLIEAVSAGMLGEVRAVNVRLDFMGGICPGFLPTRRWLSEVPSAEMTTIGSHAIITAMKLLSTRPQSVYAVKKNDFYESYAACGAEDGALMNVRFECGAVANISVARLPYQIPDEDVAIEVTGTTGYGRVRGAVVELWPAGTREEFAVNAAAVELADFAQFLSAIAENTGAAPVTFQEGVLLQEVLDAGIRSSASGQAELVAQ